MLFTTLYECKSAKSGCSEGEYVILLKESRKLCLNFTEINLNPTLFQSYPLKSILADENVDYTLDVLSLVSCFPSLLRS